MHYLYVCIGAGWYRIVAPAGTIIVEEKPNENRCSASDQAWHLTPSPSTQRPTTIWESKDAAFNLKDLTLSAFFIGFGKVTNCDSYFVYMLPDTKLQSSRYCTE